MLEQPKSTVRIFADQEEKKNMKLCHSKAIKLQRRELLRLPGVHKDKALDVGCGNGRVTRYFLQKYFGRIDMFDPCQSAINKVRQYKLTCQKIGRVDLAKMQDY